MPNLHPFLSGLPAAFVLLAIALEGGALLGGWRRETVAVAIFTALLAACLSVSAAFLSGYHAVRLASPLPERLELLAGNHHALGRAALIVAWTTVVFAWIRSRATHASHFFTSLYGIGLTALAVLTLLAGHRGGQLIFEHGVGVTTPTEQALPAAKDTQGYQTGATPTEQAQTRDR
jgi:uncharacterized membrane protein